MALTVRKKRFIGRMIGHATNPVRVHWRTWRRQEQRHTIGGVEIVLPPEHNLPYYQHRDPTYDAYAIDLLARLAAGNRHVAVIDVGANVGDTAATVLASDPRSSVISVEGDPMFLGYLARNLAAHAERATVVEGFVGPVGTRVSFSRAGSTGGFQPEEGAGGHAVEDWVSPASLLAMPAPEDLVVWKSDIDGFDIHVLVHHWDAIDSRCDVLWFEYDSPRTLGDRADDERLIRALAASGRTLLVHDNLGRRMVQLPPGDSTGLRTLSRWLHEQVDGHVVVPYLDVWALSPEAVQLLQCD